MTMVGFNVGPDCEMPTTPRTQPAPIGASINQGWRQPQRESQALRLGTIDDF